MRNVVPGYSQRRVGLTGRFCQARPKAWEQWARNMADPERVVHGTRPYPNEWSFQDHDHPRGSQFPGLSAWAPYRPVYGLNNPVRGPVAPPTTAPALSLQPEEWTVDDRGDGLHRAIIVRGGFGEDAVHLHKL